MSSSIPQLKDGEQTVYFQAGGEWCFLKTPASYQAEGAGTPCVIQCHGHHGYVKDGEADWLTEDFKLSFVNSLIESGIAVASTNATGNHWGRPSAVAANGALFDSLVEGSNVDASRMGLWGGGLGGALLWNSVTGPLLGRLRAVCLQQATISYDSVIRNHKFKSFLLEAYGLPADTPDDLAVAALAFNDPVSRTRSVDWGERASPGQRTAGGSLHPRRRGREYVVPGEPGAAVRRSGAVGREVLLPHLRGRRPRHLPAGRNRRRSPKRLLPPRLQPVALPGWR